MLSDFGGLVGLVIVVFEFLAEKINEMVIKAKFIRSLFYVKKPESMKAKFKINLGDSYLHNKLGSFDIVKSRWYNFLWSKANSE